MFKFLANLIRPKRDNSIFENIVVPTAKQIAVSEGKSKADAEYLALCLIFDDLENKGASERGVHALLEYVMNIHPNHFNDVMTYIAVKRGEITLKKEHMTELLIRHKR